MRKIGFTALLTVMLPFAAMAQDYPPVEVFGGYSYFRANPDEFNLHGWNASVTGNLTHWFGVTGDFSGHYGKPSDIFGEIPGIDINHYTIMVGPKLSYRAGAFTPFAHFLIGGARAGTNDAFFGSTSDWALATSVGGGLDINISDSIALRVAQAEWLMTDFDTGDFLFDPNDRQNNFRFSAGIVFKLGN